MDKGRKERSPSYCDWSSNGSSQISSCNSSSTSSGPSSVNLSFKSIQMEDEFSSVSTLSEGTYSNIYLAKKSHANEKVVLKAFKSELISGEEFLRELNVSYFLSAHPNILTCYNVSFMWNTSYVFVLEEAPLGPLSRILERRGGGSLHQKQVKLISQQICSALSFMHDRKLVHGDVTPHNVLVFNAKGMRVKLSDFGCTRPQGSLVLLTEYSKSEEALKKGFAPPEISTLLPLEKYHVHPSSDVWQMGILIFTCLTGSGPWACADITDPTFRHYKAWLRRKSLKMPLPLKPFTLRFIRLMKRLLEPKASNRSEIREVSKYLEDDWIKGGRAGSLSTTESTPSPPLQRQLSSRRNRKCSFEIKDSLNSLKCQSGNDENKDPSEYLNREESPKWDSHLETKLNEKRVEDWIANTNDCLPSNNEDEQELLQ